jgi:hypothetical protein
MLIIKVHINKIINKTSLLLGNNSILLINIILYLLNLVIIVFYLLNYRDKMLIILIDSF